MHISSENGWYQELPGNLKENISRTIRRVQDEFPFSHYMDSKIHKYVSVASIILSEVPIGAKILDVGCGPCDLTAILSELGYDLTGVDDLRDPWHLSSGNREKIEDFAERCSIRLIVEPVESTQLKTDDFDAVLLIDVVEHSARPRCLLNKAISLLKANSLLLIETPNHASLMNRTRLSFGRSVYPGLGFILFSAGQYRGHIREYTISELKLMLRYNEFKKTEVETVNVATKMAMCESRGLRKGLLKAYALISGLYPPFRDTILIWGRKPEHWSPLSDFIPTEKSKEDYSRHTE